MNLQVKLGIQGNFFNLYAQEIEWEKYLLANFNHVQNKEQIDKNKKKGDGKLRITKVIIRTKI